MEIRLVFLTNEVKKKKDKNKVCQKKQEKFTGDASLRESNRTTLVSVKKKKRLVYFSSFIPVRLINLFFSEHQFPWHDGKLSGDTVKIISNFEKFMMRGAARKWRSTTRRRKNKKIKKEKK